MKDQTLTPAMEEADAKKVGGKAIPLQTVCTSRIVPITVAVNVTTP
jgi:hypothetical protein